jgi:hypothetical protein
MNSKHGATRWNNRLSPRVLYIERKKLTLASSNVSRRVFSDSPDIPDTIEGAEILIKGTPNS